MGRIEGEKMNQKQVIKFMAYDADLTDYVEIPELSKRFTEGNEGLPLESSVFHWYEAGKCIEHFRIEIIKSKIVDYDNSLHTDILAQPL